MRQLIRCMPFVVAAPLFSIHGQVAAQAAEAPAAAKPAAPKCRSYDRYITRAQAAFTETPPCYTLTPEFGGLREQLAENGMGVYANFGVGYAYDVKGHDAEPQTYNGQNPSYNHNSKLGITYDLTRIGVPGDAQLTAELSWLSGNYKAANPAFATISILGINQRFAGGQLELMYGFFPLIRQYYGTVLNGNASTAASGPVSVIPIQVGMGIYAPSPAFMVTTRTADLKWYNSFSVSRSASPKGFQYDLDNNHSGLALSVPGSSTLLANEFGYKVHASSPEHANWFRAGLLYNYSDFTDFNTGKPKGNNYAGYLAWTYQVTKPVPGSARGFYFDAKVNYAPPDRNLFTHDYQATLFYIGPFQGRPADMASIGYAKSYFSSDARASFAKRRVATETDRDGLSLSYSAQITPGLYWKNSVTYQRAPTFTSPKPDAVIYQTSVSLAF